MDIGALAVILGLIASLVAIADFLYGRFGGGDKTFREWWREKRKGKRVVKNIPKLSSVDIPTSVVGEQMIAAVKTTSGPGLELMLKPVPSIRPWEILVRVSAVSICGTDLAVYYWNQWAPSRFHPPVIPGHEFCGVVVERGKNVTNVTINDFVAVESHIVCGKCSYCKSGHSHVCLETEIIGLDRDGAFAEYISIPAANAWKLPTDIPVEIAMLMEPFGNAVHSALSQELTGRNVLVTGAGSIGLMTIAIAKWAGASLICTSDLHSSRLDLARQMGADVLLNAHKPNRDLEKVILEATGGQGIDVFLEMSGSPQALQLGLTALRNAGKGVLLGMYEEPVQIDLTNLITFKGITIYGAYGRLSDRTWERMRTVLASGGIDLSPMITHEFRLDQIDEAFALVQSRRAGKVIIRPPHGMILADPIHYVPTTSNVSTPTVLWHDAYARQAKEIIVDLKSRELFLLKSELDNLFITAQELQQMLAGYRRQLLNPDLDEEQQSQFSIQITELEAEKEKNLIRRDEIRQQIETTSRRAKI